MTQEAYTTQQRAQELLQETLKIWRQGDHIDQLEGLENDPVFSLLVTALAYEANETDGEIERFKQDVLDEYARILLPYEAGHALPATAVVTANLQDGVNELQLTESSTFTLANTDYTFMPLLKTRAVKASIGSVVRLDGRRWKITLNFQEPVNDLAGMTFAISNTRFKDLKVSINGKDLPLIKPWNHANMPLQPCFAVETLLYNHAQMYQAAMTGLEVYARQNVALFYIDKEDTQPLFPLGTDRVEMIFDFTGIAEDFVFDKSHLILNAILLVNVQRNTATLSSTQPIVRIAGYNEADGKSNGQQLMHLLPPAQEQLFGKTPVTVRRVAVDRFNHAALTRLVNSLATKFHSDYYAFLNADDMNMQPAVNELQESLNRLKTTVQKDSQRDISGIYLMLEREAMASNPDISLDISYLTTSGKSVNEHLQADHTFLPAAGFDIESVKQIAKPEPGFDEVRDSVNMQGLLRYHLITNNRIITPADIKLFCYTELMNRYSVLPEMIHSITIDRKQQQETTDCGYGIYVTIQLLDNPYIRRSFAERIYQAEMLLRTMMEMRSTGLYPIYVYIQMKEK